jgi:hypothetical protein
MGLGWLLKPCHTDFEILPCPPLCYICHTIVKNKILLERVQYQIGIKKYKRIITIVSSI